MSRKIFDRVAKSALSVSEESTRKQNCETKSFLFYALNKITLGLCPKYCRGVLIFAFLMGSIQEKHSFK